MRTTSPLPALGNDEFSPGVEFHRRRALETLGDFLGVSRFNIRPPHLAERHQRIVQLAVGSDCQGVRSALIVHNHPRRTLVIRIQLKDTPVAAELIGKQAILVAGDAVDRRQLVGQDADLAGRGALTHPGAHDLGDVQRAVRVKGHIVGRNNRPAQGRDQLGRAGLNIKRGQLAAKRLGHVQPSVGTELHAVCAVQPAGWQAARELPARGPPGVPRRRPRAAMRIGLLSYLASFAQCVACL